MSKAVLLSVRPEWCDRIFSGWKTVEIRKTRPVSLKEPFKCYIYCTKGTKFFCWKAVDHLYFDDRPHKIFDRRVDGMVVGEFICDDIRRIGPEYCAVKEDIESAISGSLLTVPQVKDYAGWKSGMSYADLKDLYGWHISELKIYDKPRELRPFTGLLNTRFGVRPVKAQRPPQSWCYVRELEEVRYE